jgi:ubiquinone/menaquinone biosynthesis C-methylase UbiE
MSNAFLYDGSLDEWKKSMILNCCGKVSSVMDVGCNTGDLVAYFESIGVSAAGVDVNNELIDVALRKYPGLRFEVANSLNNYDDSSVDVVIAWNVLEHVADEMDYLKNMWRMAKSKVVLSIPKEDAISLPDSRVTYRPYVDITHLRYYTKEKLQELACSIGCDDFEIIETSRVRPMLAYAKIGINKKFCQFMDNLLWMLSRNKSVFYSNLVVVFNKIK